jgi:predicted nucleic acid-binding protein
LAATEFFALAHRWVRAGLIRAEIANAALLDFDAFVGSRTRRLSQSPAAGALAALLARDSGLKLSAADALQLALSAEGGHRLVTFDVRLAEAARARSFGFEIP